MQLQAFIYIDTIRVPKPSPQLHLLSYLIQISVMPSLVPLYPRILFGILDPIMLYGHPIYPASFLCPLYIRI